MERMKYALPIIVLFCIFGVIAFMIYVRPGSGLNIFIVSIILGVVGFVAGIVGISTVLILRYLRNKKNK